MFFEIDDNFFIIWILWNTKFIKSFFLFSCSAVLIEKTCHATYERVNEYPYAFQNGVQTNFTQSLFFYLEETGTE